MLIIKVIDEDECGRILDAKNVEHAKDIDRLESLAEFERNVNEQLRGSKRARLPKSGTGSVEELDIGLHE